MAEIVLAIFVFLVVIGFAIFPPLNFQQWLNFSLAPPGELIPDLAEHQRPLLTKTFLSAWATIILLTAALCFYIFRDSSRLAARWWLLFWFASLISFLIHIYLGVSALGGWRSPRLTLPPWVPISIMVWWIIDVIFAFKDRHVLPFTRPLLHVLLFVLFLWASLGEGELVLSQSFGVLMGLTVLVAFVTAKYRFPTPKGSLSSP
jgi:hypothetical protein